MPGKSERRLTWALVFWSFLTVTALAGHPVHTQAQ